MTDAVRFNAGEAPEPVSTQAPFVYKPEVLAALLRHGVRPTAATSPGLVRTFVRDLYKFEIVRLKERLLRHEFPRAEYAGRVDQLRRQYPVLALLPDQFVE